MKIQPYKEVADNEVVGTVMELFAGIGGFRIGLSRHGLKTVFSNQWEPTTKVQHASSVYVKNFGPDGHSNEDIATVADSYASGARKLPSVDVLVGGFPCQDYSVAKARNHALGIEGKKGVLWWSIHKIVAKRKPKYIVLENVDRLLKSPTSQKGRDFAIMLRTLGDLGYLIEWRVINSADYGFPQRRIRVFIVARKVPKRLTMSVGQAEKVCTESGVLARALPVKKVSVSVEEIDLSNSLENLSAGFGKNFKSSPFLNAGVFLGSTAYSMKVVSSSAEKSHVLGDVIDSKEEAGKEFFLDNCDIPKWKAQKGAKKLLRTHAGSGTKYVYAEGAMAFPDSLNKPSRTILTAEGGRSPSRFRHVIEEDGKLRRLTPRELERLSGFPLDWTESGTSGKMSNAKRAFFIGNALVVGIVEKIGAVIASELTSE